MKKYTCAALLLAVVLFTGCATTEKAEPSSSATAAMQQIAEWPVNSNTASVPAPQTGTPDYVIADEKAGYYAIFYKDISAQEGKEYLDVLEENGYEQMIADANEASAGVLLQNETTHLSVSIAEGTLGIYITKATAP